jgi:hypothetical protein
VGSGLSVQGFTLCVPQRFDAGRVAFEYGATKLPRQMRYCVSYGMPYTCSDCGQWGAHYCEAESRNHKKEKQPMEARQNFVIAWQLAGSAGKWCCEELWDVRANADRRLKEIEASAKLCGASFLKCPRLLVSAPPVVAEEKEAPAAEVR